MYENPCNQRTQYQYAGHPGAGYLRQTNLRRPVGATGSGLEIAQFQSNHEGAIVDKIQACYGEIDGIVINPAAYTHTSVAILDALKSVAIPAVEVHISDVDAREPFRQISYAGMYCEKTIKGQGLDGYRQAILYLKDKYC